jgi:hypothetical protein
MLTSGAPALPKQDQRIDDAACLIVRYCGEPTRHSKRCAQGPRRDMRLVTMRINKDTNRLALIVDVVFDRWCFPHLVIILGNI